MSQSIKSIKSSMGQSEYSNYLMNSKKYYSIYTSLIKGEKIKHMDDKRAKCLSNKSNKLNLSEVFSESTSFSSGDVIREEIINWLFSLPLESRIKIATVENNWLVNMVHQMFFHYKCDNKCVFQKKPSELFEEKESKDNKVTKSNFSLATKPQASLGFKQGDISKYCEEDVYLSNLMNYFNFKSNKNSGDNDLIEQIMLNDLLFYSTHSDLDCLTLAVRVLNDKSIFEYYFKFAGNQRSFASLIKPYYDTNCKQYAFNLPDWFNTNEYNSIGKYILAHFEQNIIIKYVLNLNKKDKLMHSLINEEKLNSVFVERKNLIDYLSKNFQDQSAKEDIIMMINPCRIFNEINHDEDVKNIIKGKGRHPDIGYKSFVSRKFASMEPVLSGKNENETKEKIADQIKKNHPVLFIDKLIYTQIDLLWKLDFFISKRIFNILHFNYTEKNANDLISDLDNEIKYESKKSKKSNKKINKNKQNNTPDPLIAMIDPDYIYYAPYYNESKTATKIHNHSSGSMREEDVTFKKSKVATTIINLKTGEIKSDKPDNYNREISNYYKEKLMDTYTYGNTRMIEDFIRNYFLADLLHDVVTNAREPLSLKTSEQTIISSYHEDTQSFKNDYIEATHKSILNDEINIEKTPLNVVESNNKQSNICNETTKQTKKKKKEPVFFLYDTTKKKKDRSNANTKPFHDSNLNSNTSINKSTLIDEFKGEKDINKEKEKAEIKIENIIRIEKNENLNINNEIITNEVPSSSKTIKNNEPHNIPVIKNNYYIFNTFTQVGPSHSKNPSSYPNPMMMYKSPLFSHAKNYNSNLNQMNLNKHSNEYLNFLYRLHNDIIRYHNDVSENLNKLKEMKICAINLIEKLISENISEEFSLDVYGSFASDLSIETSDIDMKIRMKNESEDTIFDIDTFIMSMVKKFHDLNIFDSVIPIYTATIPIIKIVIDPSKIVNDENLLRLEEFKNSSSYKEYKFKKEEIEKIKIDITFLNMTGLRKQPRNSFNLDLFQTNQMNEGQMSSVEYAKNMLIAYPEIKPLIHVIKRYLVNKKLNNCFNGGLSSFCLFLLVLAFLKFTSFSQNQSKTNKNNLGRLLLDFLEFYGKIFNFHCCTVDLNLHNPFVFSNEFYDMSPVILDPLSYLNASKSSFRIDDVQQSFSEAYIYLIDDKNRIESETDNFENSNLIYNLLLNS